MQRLYESYSPHNQPKTGFGHKAFIMSIPEYLDCCKCLGSKPGYRLVHKPECQPSLGKPECTQGCSIWVHNECGKSSFSWSRECQVCSRLYMPTEFPDFDWLCLDCFPR